MWGKRNLSLLVIIKDALQKKSFMVKGSQKSIISKDWRSKKSIERHPSPRDTVRHSGFQLLEWSSVLF